MTKGCALVQLERRSEALICYQQAVQLEPTHPDALPNLARCLCRLGRNSEAVEVIKRRLILCPDDHEAYIDLGVAYRLLGQLPEALEAYQCFHRLAPDCAEAVEGIGEVLCSLDRYGEALDKDPAFEVLGNVAWCLDKLDRQAEASAAYERAISHFPGKAQFRAYYAKLLEERGLMEEAELQIRRAYELDPDCINGDTEVLELFNRLRGRAG
ncbi:MAG: tetratricopeptide repeat protein [Candidatus Polarisedimenticolia bacterium]